MAVEILSPREADALRVAARMTAATLVAAARSLRAGMSTLDVDKVVHDDTVRRGGRPATLHYKGYPRSCCVSRNEVVCHGIPTAKELLASGDIVNVDVSTEYKGWYGDTSASFFVGPAAPSPDARRVVETARACLNAGIAAVRDGARLGDIGAAIEKRAKEAGCSVVRDYGGHGIGRVFHGEPHVSHVGTAGAGLRLRAGMAFTIEPMVNLGGPGVRELADHWTVVTDDGTLSAQFEHTVLVTRDGCEVLTARTEDLWFSEVRVPGEAEVRGAIETLAQR